jgi:PTH1 family peptidyl-tRNA hydrolase
MFIIAGLGNPGTQYKWTRHNAGFEVISKLAYDYKIDMKSRKFRAVFGDGSIEGTRVRLVMPQTYMNLSGESIRDILQYFKIPVENLIVVYDDTALPVGTIRVREQGSAGGQKGMESIIYQLETDVFCRVRVGIGEKPEWQSLSDYVLTRFGQEERDDIIRGITMAGDAVVSLLTNGISDTMNKFNRKPDLLD